MRTLFSLLSVIAIFFSQMAAAETSKSELSHFFDRLVGDYEGKGEKVIIHSEEHSDFYQLESDSYVKRPSSRKTFWRMEDEITRNDDVNYSETISWYLDGDRLYEGPYEAGDEVEIVSFEDRILVYELRWSNPPHRKYRKVVTIDHSGRFLKVEKTFYLREVEIEHQSMNYN